MPAPPLPWARCGPYNGDDATSGAAMGDDARRLRETQGRENAHGAGNGALALTLEAAALLFANGQTTERIILAVCMESRRLALTRQAPAAVPPLPARHRAGESFRRGGAVGLQSAWRRPRG